MWVRLTIPGNDSLSRVLRLGSVINLCKLGVRVDRGGLGLHAYTLHGNTQAMLDGAFNDVPGRWQRRRQREVDVGATRAEVVDGVSGKPTASISEGGVSQ